MCRGWVVWTRRRQEVKGQSGKTTSAENSTSSRAVTCVDLSSGGGVCGVKSGLGLSLFVRLQCVSDNVDA